MKYFVLNLINAQLKNKFEISNTLIKKIELKKKFHLARKENKFWMILMRIPIFWLLNHTNVGVQYLNSSSYDY